MQWTPIGRALQHALAGLLREGGERTRGPLGLVAVHAGVERDDPRQLALPFGDESQ